MAGFGHGKFGDEPFGISDFGYDTIIGTFPAEYLEDSAPDGTDPFDDSTNPLMQILMTIARSFQQMRINVDNMEQLSDYQTASSDILILMGNTFGLDIDQNDPDFLKRSFVAHASQWLQIKSSKEGYSVRGLASGFIVTVQNYWRIDESYSSLIPPRHLFYFVPPQADPGTQPYLHTDAPPGTYPGTPIVEDSTYAKSSWIKVIFEIKNYALFPSNFNTLLDLAIDKISDVQGIHHELTVPEFRITMNYNVLPTLNLLLEEKIADYAFNEFDHFDIIPADMVPCDNTWELNVA